MFFYTRVLPLLAMGVPIIIAALVWQRLNKPLRLAALICTMNLLFETSGNFLGYKNISNIWLYNFSDLMRFTLWLVFFYLIFIGRQSKFVFMLLMLFPCFWLLALWFQPVTEFQTLSFVIGSILILLCCFLFLLNEYQSESTERITLSAYFWICIGLLIYYSLNLPFIGLYNWLLESSLQFTSLYFKVCVIGSSIVLSLLMGKGFLCTIPKKKSGF